MVLITNEDAVSVDNESNLVEIIAATADPGNDTSKMALIVSA